MRVVLDTAALINALRSVNGAAAHVVQLALQGRIILLMDMKLAFEYRDVALRAPQLAATLRSVNDTLELLNGLEAIAEEVIVRFKHRPLSLDLNDDMVLDIAINGRADAIVTNNIRHFRAAAKPFGIRVYTPSDFLINFRSGEQEHAG